MGLDPSLESLMMPDRTSEQRDARNGAELATAGQRAASQAKRWIVRQVILPLVVAVIVILIYIFTRMH